MKNWEKYESKIKEIGVSRFASNGRKVEHCINIDCGKCEFLGSDNKCSIELRTDWLYAEYTEPEPKLKICPFCGGKAEIARCHCGHSGGGEFSEGYECGCGKCKIKFRSTSRFVIENGKVKFRENGYEKCIEAWNRRADNEVTN